MFSSVQAEILVEEFDNLIKYYFDELVKASEVLGSSHPTFDKFSEQLQKSGHYASMILPEIVAVVVMERHADANIEAFLGDPNSDASKNIAIKMFQNPRYVAILKAVLPFLNKRGFLEMPHAPKPSANGHVEPVQDDVPIAAKRTIEKPTEEVPKIISEELKVVEEIVAVVQEQESIVEDAPSFAPVMMATAHVEPQSQVEALSNGNHVEETSPVVVTPEPIRVTIQEAKPSKPRLKSRIEETINKFAALENNGKTTFE